MSIHPSLNTSEKDKKARSVLKRVERLKLLMDKGEWKEGQSIFGLPKIKTMRLKIKKEKAAPAAAETEAAETAPTTTEATKAKPSSDSKSDSKAKSESKAK